MAENVTLTNLTSIQNDTTAVSKINTNSATITSAFVDVLSRSGVSPNQMSAPLDMSNNPIINLPAPASAYAPVRLIDITTSNPLILTLQTTVNTVSALPTPTSSLKGARSFVSDANATTFASVVAGSGTNAIPVYCDGTNWRIG
jgi:hypothetical protein